MPCRSTVPTIMVDCRLLAIPGDKPCLPPDILEELNATVTALFERAINVSNASSSLERIVGIRDSMISSVAGALSHPVRVHNAALSLQNCLPAELWLDVWARLSLDDRVAVSHVCSRWRDLIISCPDMWTAIDCFAFMGTTPDGSACRFSTAGLVPVALERAKGMKLSLDFFFDSSIGDSSVYRFADTLAPHAGNIAALDLTCTVQQSELILHVLQPLSALEGLVHGMLSPRPYIPTQPPIFECPFVLPELKTLFLPQMQHYGWPCVLDHPFNTGGGNPTLPMPIRFPALQKLSFAPAREIDIELAVRDCPRITSLTLVLGFLFYREEIIHGFSCDRLTHIYLLDVPLGHLDWALSVFNISQRQYVVVTIMDDPPEISLPVNALPPVSPVSEMLPPPPTPTVALTEDSEAGGFRSHLDTKGIYRRMSPQAEVTEQS
ncbi:hypothetical protein AURDEDRAFT_165909 [Auricularia subglabra TFB-10046 SS5]|nr:hypothetical protein AURDEDRAFT_165909 [Auricularia subglabra TFB-10046 SS5]